MDDGGHRENGRQRTDYYKGNLQCNGMPHSVKDQKAMIINIRSINWEMEAAYKERDRALDEKKLALEQRDEAIKQRDAAIAHRNEAIRERDNAIAALHFQEATMNAQLQRGGSKRVQHANNHRLTARPVCKSGRDSQIREAFPITAIPSEAIIKSKRPRETKSAGGACPARSTKKTKKVGEDLNRHVTTDGSKAEWEAQELGLMEQISFDESRMPIPVCTCTGVARQCYKWGSGGWQSSCCTTSLSVYPLPQMPNKRHARMGGRKMSGSVFTRLLSRLASQGHDLSVPLDLKNYWAKHGTNRYITIK